MLLLARCARSAAKTAISILRKKGLYPFSSLFRVTSVILYKLWLADQTKWRNPITTFLLVSTFHFTWSYLTKTLTLHAFSWVPQTLCILYRHCWQHYYFIGFSTLYTSSSDFKITPLQFGYIWLGHWICWSAFVFCILLSHFVGQSKTSLRCVFIKQLNNFPSWYSVSLDFNSDGLGQIPSSSSSLQMQFCLQSIY